MIAFVVAGLLFSLLAFGVSVGAIAMVLGHRCECEDADGPDELEVEPAEAEPPAPPPRPAERVNPFAIVRQMSREDFLRRSKACGCEACEQNVKLLSEPNGVN